MYYENEDDDLLRCEQIDVSNEPGYWKLARLLASPHLDEVRLVGENDTSIRIARMLVLAGKFTRRRTIPTQLPLTGDEEYPMFDPYIFICPLPDPAAFD